MSRKRKLSIASCTTQLYRDDHREVLRICKTTGMTPAAAVRQLAGEALRARRVGNRGQIPSRDDGVMAPREVGDLAAMIRQLQTDFAGFAARMSERNSSDEAQNEAVREAVGAAAEALKREIAAGHLRQQESLAEAVSSALARSNLTLALYDLLEQILGNAVMAKYAILRLLQEYLGRQNEKPEAIIARIQKDQDECERDVEKMVRENKMAHRLSPR